MNQNLEEIVKVFSIVTKEAANQAIPEISYSKTIHIQDTLLN